MENTRNPGLVAVGVGVALAVLFALLGITTVLPGRVGFGLAGVCLAVSAFLYIFYARGNAVSKTGYGALIAILAIGLIIPILMVDQQQAQANVASQQYQLTLERGASIFGQYCATCHGFFGQGLNAPQLNNSSAVNKLSDEDLTRIIDAGIASNGDPTTLAMPAWLNTYGGSLTEDDVSYLVSLIRSSDKSYLAQNNLPTNLNGFNLVMSTLTNPTQIAQAQQEKQSGGRPPASNFVSETGKTAVALQIVNTPTSTIANWGFSPQYVEVSTGTTITWTNVSNFIHTVVSKPGMPASWASSVLNSGTTSAPGGTFKFTFTKAGYYEYFCSIHPAMIGWVLVK